MAHMSAEQFKQDRKQFLETKYRRDRRSEPPQASTDKTAEQDRAKGSLATKEMPPDPNLTAKGVHVLKDIPRRVHNRTKRVRGCPE